MIRQHTAADKTPVTPLLVLSFRNASAGLPNGDDTDSDADVTVTTFTADTDVTESRDSSDSLIPTTTEVT